ncbi:MAG: DnaJ domain-containing protein [Clostridia bacterium]|nr:DnaJ domain-containing protein [Clostridia bacterium]MBQ7122950.1 DnaJ domain-containing protein [Clostridia bacterium]
MRNPYDVLGVPQGASQDQINAAYRELMRRYQDSGDSRKIDELNSAYDAVIMGAGSSSGGYNGYGRSAPDYSDIRAKINSGRLDDAQILLDGMQETSRDAQWYYLKGTIQQKRGWLEEAAKNFATASNLDPSNNTYKMAYNKVNNARSGGYRTERRRSDGDKSGCSGCDMCTGLLCADCCCECFGGDLIPCC